MKGNVSKGKNNIAGIAQGSSIRGIDNLAGGKAFNILTIVHNGKAGYYVLDSVEGLAVGDVYSVHLAYQDGGSEQFENVGKITYIDTELNRVTVDKMADNGDRGYSYPTEPAQYIDENGIDTEINTFRIVEKPLIGTRTIGCVTTANGLKNKATSKGATVDGGTGNHSYGSWSHTQNKNNKAGYCADAGGNSTEARGFCSFTRGNIVKVFDWCSGAIGNNITLKGLCSFLTGQNMTGKGKHIFGFGFGCNIEANEAMAGGNNSEVLADLGVGIGDRVSVKGKGKNAFVIGLKTIANSLCQFVRGKYNIEDSNEKYVEIVGNGEDSDNRSNAYTLDWHGNGWYAGELAVGSRRYKIVKENVFNTFKEITQRNSDYILSLKYNQGLCLIEGLDGMGTETDPVLIGSEADWETLVTALNADSTLCANGKHYKLIADLDFANYTWANKACINNFYAHLDGDGHTISNYVVGENVYGLFWQLQVGSVIENLGMIDVVFSGVNEVYYGSITGRSKSSTIRNCYVYGIVEGNNCTAKYGGLVGQVFWANGTEGCTIENSYVVSRYGEIGYVGKSSNLGGLVGEVFANTQSIIRIVNCYIDIATLVPSGKSGTTYQGAYSYYVGSNTTLSTVSSPGVSQTIEHLQAMATVLGSAYETDEYNINSGYPILIGTI